jgi:ribosomal protein L28
VKIHNESINALATVGNRDLLNRLAKIESLDKSARSFLANLGKKTFFTPIEEKLLSVLEAEYRLKRS